MENIQDRQLRHEEKALLATYDKDIAVFPKRFEKAAHHSNSQSVAKRIMDISLGVVAMLLAIPIIGVAAVLIKINSRGPVFFSQERVGLEGRRFTMHKLRTMVDDAHSQKQDLLEHNEANGPIFKIKSDPRVTRVGYWLRKFSIDELPQIFNVLKGEMSLVGPRPALPEEVEEYETWQRSRLNVLPGITGLWQVSGRSNLTFEEMVTLDIEYADNWSLAKDIGIILRTALVVVLGKGAY
jgi:exopolysaccharide biosynthesis polyprenyl glycosylphosphotransferase